jgi:S1-C subfamily serine protease
LIYFFHPWFPQIFDVFRFWVGDGQILTSFESIDGAASLRISLSSGTQIKTDLAIAWNRWQDWALLKVDAAPKAFLKRGDNGAANVGDHCVFLELGPVGSKLTDGTVTGTNSFPRAGTRLLVASGVSPESVVRCWMNLETTLASLAEG